MVDQLLQIDRPAVLSRGAMVVSLTGWMDGGNASTATVELLRELVGGDAAGHIDPAPFYLLNFPGSMEIAAMFRPRVKVADGVLEHIEMPENRFWVCPRQNLALFSGQEPNMRWELYTDCVFTAAHRLGVETVLFIGSVGGAVPHTRDPRVYASASDATMRQRLLTCHVPFTNYEGPGSVTTYMLSRAVDAGLSMGTLVAEIPAYVQGRNPRAILTLLRKLAAVLGTWLDLESLRSIVDQWEKRVNEAVGQHPDLLEHIQRLEEEYDNDVFETQMSDLKDWLEQKGIQVD